MSILNGQPWAVAMTQSEFAVIKKELEASLITFHGALAPMSTAFTLNDVRMSEGLPPFPEPKPQAPGFVGPRGTYKVKDLNTDWHNIPEGEEEYGEPVEYADANLVGSKVDLEEDGHLPVIDLDLPCHLEPSTKPDHYHLYVNKVVKWDDYVKLLDAMLACGLINEGFHVMSIRRGQSYVRRPGVFKKPGEADS